jgi:hypothetical protein
MDMSDDDDVDVAAYPSIKLSSSFRTDSFAPITTPLSKKKKKSGVKQKSTMESLFPLVSFLDFWDDDRSRNWMSFIEVSSVVS